MCKFSVRTHKLAYHNSNCTRLHCFCHGNGKWRSITKYLSPVSKIHKTMVQYCSFTNARERFPSEMYHKLLNQYKGKTFSTTQFSCVYLVESINNENCTQSSNYFQAIFNWAAVIVLVDWFAQFWWQYFFSQRSIFRCRKKLFALFVACNYLYFICYVYKVSSCCYIFCYVIIVINWKKVL